MEIKRIALLMIGFLVMGVGLASAQVELKPEAADKLVIEKPAPVVPPVAKAADVHGFVKVEITVSEAGAVVTARATSGHPLLKNAGQKAALTYKYKPYFVDGKPVSFKTTIDIPFDPETTKEVYENDDKVSARFFKQEERCRAFIRTGQWKEAEPICISAAQVSEEFVQARQLEKMDAHKLVGQVMMGQRRYADALESFSRALTIGSESLTEKDAELAQVYGEIGMAHHGLRNLDKAREFYRKAEKSFQLAYANIRGDGTDEAANGTSLAYIKPLRDFLELHELAAQQAGAFDEAKEVRAQIAKLP